ncbi:MAG: 2-octaprenyl-6-methoxyphenyl hydroxylase [Gammaproteobacteria bacterium RIFCSPHIGHO2_12_FULL_63_22]|nr:MAG: 2-octaprenyl-6-methoxyphenyl hydroxylase [Gammaproteobacteria bacterium RIFCSPHIGHO2_12_FULL_63_22]
MDFDIVVLGGGLVGSSLACALDGRGYRIALVEGSLPRESPPGFDERKLALAAASLNALGTLGVLAHLSEPPSPIRRIHVSRQGDFGVVRLAASDVGRDAFGGVVSARELGQALEQRLAALSDLRLLRPQTVSGIRDIEGGIALNLQPGDGAVAASSAGGDELTTRLLVAADGTQSFARQARGIAVDRHDYLQTLLVCSLVTDRPADGGAYERFTADGPVALLPMGRQYGAICAVPRAEAEAVMAMDDVAYMDYFQVRFGWRAGRVVRVGKRSAYPIARVIAERIVARRMVLMGNAAQTIHPIGAQGFNLGLRDALSLAEVLVAAGADADPGSEAVLQAYQSSRREDRERTLSFSDGLARATGNASVPMHLLRSIGLMALANVPGLSAPLVSGAMGFRGNVPALSRGGA